MNAVIISVLVSGAFTLVIAYISDKFGRKRDREAEWRKVKLEQYREYTAALSGTVHQGRDATAQRRYADAVNNLGLIAPKNVLKALYSFQKEISYSNSDRNSRRYEELISDLMRAMRADCQPEDPEDEKDFTFWTLDIPPTDAT
jgi:hypothetical protein